jgi:hypothetical protein
VNAGRGICGGRHRGRPRGPPDEPDVVSLTELFFGTEDHMAVENRSIPRQLAYLTVAFLALLAVLHLLARW